MKGKVDASAGKAMASKDAKAKENGS